MPHVLEQAWGVLKVQVEGDQTLRDDSTGQLLEPELVRAARAKELEYFDVKDVAVEAD